MTGRERIFRLGRGFENAHLLFPQVAETRCDKAIECRERLGGLLRITTETPRELAIKSR